MPNAVQVTPVVANTGVSGNQTLVFGSNLNAGDAVLLCFQQRGSGASGPTLGTPTDNQGNTYNQLVTQTNGSNGQDGWAFLAENVAGGPCTITVPFTGGAVFVFVGVALEFAGLQSSAFDQSASTTSGSTTPSVGPTGSTTVATELIVAVDLLTFGGAAPTFTAGAGYAMEVSGGDGVDRAVGVESKTVSSTGTQTADFTIGNAASPFQTLLLVTLKAGTPPTTGNNSYGNDAYVSIPPTVSYSNDAYVTTPPSISYGIDADVQVDVSKSYNIDAFVSTVGWFFRQSKKVSGNSTNAIFTTFDLPVLAHSLLVVIIANFGPSAASAADTNGNVYSATPNTPMTVFGNGRVYVFYAKDANAGTTLIQASVGGPQNLDLIIAEYALLDNTSPFIAENFGLVTGSSPGDFVDSGNINTSGKANSLLISAAYNETAETNFTPAAGWTTREQINNPGDFRGLALFDKRAVTPGTYDSDVQFDAAASGGLVEIAAFAIPEGPSVDHSYSIDASVLPDKNYGVDAFVQTTAVQTSFTHGIDALVSTLVRQFILVAGGVQFPIFPTAYLKTAATVATPAVQFISVAATIKTSLEPFVPVAGTIVGSSRSYVKVKGDISSDKLHSYGIDAAVGTPLTAFVNVAGTVVGSLAKGMCGNFPDASYIRVAGWIVNPGNDSIQMPGQGYTKQDDWYSSQDAAASYKPGSIIKISGSTLPPGGVTLIPTAFTVGVASFQTRTRTWLRRVDAAPSGILISTKTQTHTLPNGAVITTVTTVQQNQDTTITTVQISNSTTPNRVSTIVTEKNSSGNSSSTETDTETTNGNIISNSKKNIFTSPPTQDNIQPLSVRTLDGIVHYQFFGPTNQEWAGGDQEGTTTIEKTVNTQPIAGGQFRRVTVEQETDPTGKITHTQTDETGSDNSFGTTTTQTDESFSGVQTTTVKTVTFPNGAKKVSTTVSNSSTGDSTETEVETVTDEFGQVTTTTTETLTQTFVEGGITKQRTTKTVTVEKSGVTTTDVTTEVSNDFEDDIVNQKIKVYGIQEFTLTCVIDEFTMLGLAEINFTHQKNYALLELFGQQLGNANLSYALRQVLIKQFNQANACIAPVTLQALGRIFFVVFAQSASAFRAKYIPGPEPHVYELQLILQARSDLINGTIGV